METGEESHESHQRMSYRLMSSVQSHPLSERGQFWSLDDDARLDLAFMEVWTHGFLFSRLLSVRIDSDLTDIIIPIQVTRKKFINKYFFNKKALKLKVVRIYMEARTINQLRMLGFYRAN